MAKKRHTGEQIISKLREAEILLLSTKVGRTYTNRIRSLFDPELLAAIGRARS